MKKTEMIAALKLKEAQAWVTLQTQHQIEYETIELGNEYLGEKWKNVCLHKWAQYSDLLKEFDIECFTSLERELLISKNLLKK